jgi:hypothetical protein
VSVIEVAVVVTPQVAPEGAAATVASELLIDRSTSPKSMFAMPPKLAGKVITIVSPAATPLGVLNLMVWFDTALGAESLSVLVSDVTFAASARRNDGRPSDHKVIAMAATAAITWSNENEVLAVLMGLLYVVLACGLL